MRWTPGGRSGDLEDQRGSSGGGGFGGLGGGLPRMGIGGFIILALLSLIFHKNFFAMFGGSGAPAGAPASQNAPVSASPEEEKEVQFVSFVLDDAQNTWTQVFSQRGADLPARQAGALPRRGAVGLRLRARPRWDRSTAPATRRSTSTSASTTSCATASAPPATSREAYVIAHELGHHVQNLLGIERQGARGAAAATRTRPTRCRCGSSCRPTATRASGAIRRSSATSSRRGTSTRRLNAAAAVGDDRIQKQTTGRVNPETWTHGSVAAALALVQGRVRLRQDRELRHLQQPVEIQPRRGKGM